MIIKIILLYFIFAIYGICHSFELNHTGFYIIEIKQTPIYSYFTNYSRSFNSINSAFKLNKEDDDEYLQNKNTSFLGSTFIALFLFALCLLNLILILSNRKNIKLLKFRLDYNINHSSLRSEQNTLPLDNITNNINNDRERINNEIISIYNILKALGDKLAELEKNKIEHISKDFKNEDNLNTSSEILPISTQVEHSHIFYLNYPNLDGSFNENKSKRSDFTRPFILILKTEIEHEGEIDIIPNVNAHSNLISNYHLYLNPIADIIYHNKNGKKIEVLKKGAVKFLNGKWIVSDKLQVNII